MQLSFLNANWLRKYPFQGDMVMLDISGNRISDDIIVGCRLMLSLASFTDYTIAITKVYFNNGYIAIEFSGANGALGVARGQITDSNQSIPVIPFDPTFSGFVVIGNTDSIQTQGCYNYTTLTGALEPSVITGYVAPAITGVDHNTSRLTGQVTFNPTNLVMTVNEQNINFDVLAPGDVASRMDRTARLLTCLNPIISGINTVNPFPTTDGNNIDIYGIAPVKIGATGGVITIYTDTTLQSVCTPQTIPPTDDSNVYPFDITTTTTTEWQTWPLFGGTGPSGYTGSTGSTGSGESTGYTGSTSATGTTGPSPS